MTEIFQAIGSLFGGGGGAASMQPPQINLPTIASPVAPPTTPTRSSADVAMDALANTPRGPMGSMATILTGGLGDTSRAPVARKTLLGG